MKQPERVPGASTLKKYGLSLKEWKVMWRKNGGRCWVCDLEPKPYAGKPGLLVIDHEHARGWKYMPPEKRKRYVRGLLCSHCNWRMVPARASGNMMAKVAAYLINYEDRRDAE